MRRTPIIVASIAAITVGSLLRFQTYTVSVNGGKPITERRILLPWQDALQWPAGVPDSAEELNYSATVSGVYGLKDLESMSGFGASRGTLCPTTNSPEPAVERIAPSWR